MNIGDTYKTVARFNEVDTPPEVGVVLSERTLVRHVGSPVDPIWGYVVMVQDGLPDDREEDDNVRFRWEEAIEQL